jgi:DNA-binding NarL/FixJ family response regulator
MGPGSGLGRGRLASRPMAKVLIVADDPHVRAEVRSVLGEPDDEVLELTEGLAVTPTVKAHPVDLVVVDLQVGNMGGMAACLDLRLESSAGRMPHVPVLMLLDRRADVHLARRSGAEGFLVKPLDPIRLRRAVQAVLRGETYFDRSYEPVPTLVAPPAIRADAGSGAPPG